MSLQAKCSEVSTAWNIPCSSEGEGRTFVSHLMVEGGGGGGAGRRGQEFFLLKRKGRPTLFLEKYTKIPQPSTPQEKTYLP